MLNRTWNRIRNYKKLFITVVLIFAVFALIDSFYLSKNVINPLDHNVQGYAHNLPRNHIGHHLHSSHVRMTAKGVGDSVQFYKDAEIQLHILLAEKYPQANVNVSVLREQHAKYNKKKTKYFDPGLLQLIRNYWILPPSKLPYNLKEPEKKDFSMGQSGVVDKILASKEHGFFVECGALDGETRSNTLWFEQQRKWSGLLIEAGPVNYQRLVKKNRKTYSSPACLGVTKYPTVMQFNRGKNQGRVIDNPSAFNWISKQRIPLHLLEVQCFPLVSLLLALNRTKIDYFSLDVEGVELEVLQTIPFDRIDITVLTVEFVHNKAGKQGILAFMDKMGYRNVKEIVRQNHLANDFVFVKKDYRLLNDLDIT